MAPCGSGLSAPAGRCTRSTADGDVGRPAGERCGCSAWVACCGVGHCLLRGVSGVLSGGRHQITPSAATARAVSREGLTTSLCRNRCPSAAWAWPVPIESLRRRRRTWWCALEQAGRVDAAAVGRRPGGHCGAWRAAAAAPAMVGSLWLLVVLFGWLGRWEGVVLTGWLLSGVAVLTRPGERVAVRVGSGFRRPTTAQAVTLAPLWSAALQRCRVDPRDVDLYVQRTPSRTRPPPAAAASPSPPGLLPDSEHIGWPATCSSGSSPTSSALTPPGPPGSRWSRSGWPRRGGS